MGVGDSTGAVQSTTEEYNGTSWSSGGDLTTGRASGAAAGTQSAGLYAGGYISSTSNITEEYDTGGGSYTQLFTASGGL